MLKNEDIKATVENIAALAINIDEMDKKGLYAFKEVFLKFVWKIELFSDDEPLEQARLALDKLDLVFNEVDNPRYNRSDAIALIQEKIEFLNEYYHRKIIPKRQKRKTKDEAAPVAKAAEPTPAPENTEETVPLNEEAKTPEPAPVAEPEPLPAPAVEPVVEHTGHGEEWVDFADETPPDTPPEPIETPVSIPEPDAAVEVAQEKAKDNEPETIPEQVQESAIEATPASAVNTPVTDEAEEWLDEEPESEPPIPPKPQVSLEDFALDEEEEKHSAPAHKDGESLLVFVAKQPAQEAKPEAQSEKKFEPVPDDEDESEEDFINEYLDELRDFIETLESELLNLKGDYNNKDAVHAVFRMLHTIKGNAGIMEHRRLGNIAHQAENLMSLVRENVTPMNADILQIILETTDVLKQIVYGLSVVVREEKIDDVTYDRIIDKLTIAQHNYEYGETELPAEELANVPEPQEPEADVIAPIMIPEAEESTATPVARQEAEQESVRIATTKLDALIDMVGELVISANLLLQDRVVRQSDDIEFLKKVAHLSRAISEMQKSSTSLRMIPIGNTFQKMRRVIHEYTRHADKAIELVIKGSETEIDRHIVNRLNEPLVHMVRNACDHGIETKDERRAAGKPVTGRIMLNAYHKGDNIVIEVQDDGQGMDREAIRAKAIQKGLLMENENISDSDLFKLVSLAGFTTAAKITDISGRGVGMDVVSQVIQSLRGRMEISSEPNRGTTFSIYLPLTLAIIEGLLIRTGEQVFVIPVANVKRFIKPRQEFLSRVMGKGELYKQDKELIPILRLAQALNIVNKKDCRLADCILVVVTGLSRDYALAVDEILGIQDVVVKKLSDTLKELKEFSGSTILGNGEVSLILDVHKLTTS